MYLLYNMSRVVTSERGACTYFVIEATLIITIILYTYISKSLIGLPIGYSVIVAVILLQVVLLEDVDDFHEVASFKNVERKIIEKCGHAISVEHPYKAATEIIRFITKHSSHSC